jgi:long-chain acyl-CoA synthetase
MELGLGEVDLSLPQYRVLGLIEEGSALASLLAERLAVRPPSVTAVVDGLVSRGLVARHPRDDDRRRVALTLTPQGRRVLAEADAATGERIASIAGALGEPDAGHALAGIALWHDALLARHKLRTGAR